MLMQQLQTHHHHQPWLNDLIILGQGSLLHTSNEAACFIRKVGGSKNDAVFYFWGKILSSDFTTTSLCGMSILHFFKFFLLAKV